MPRIVVSDTSPLRYLVLIDEADLLHALYTEVLIPETVARELSQRGTPERVRNWLDDGPGWLRIIRVAARNTPAELQRLDAGEREAILLAIETKADLVLMDDRDGVEHARRLGLTVVGTLGILDRGAERRLVELAPAIAKLRETNFRVDPTLLDRLLAADAERTRIDRQNA